jgi:hypothetical protein
MITYRDFTELTAVPLPVSETTLYEHQNRLASRLELYGFIQRPIPGPA